MTVSTRVFQTFSGRRRHTVDPAKHFAIRIKDGGAAPISREQFLDITHRVCGMASLLKKLAAAGIRDAKMMYKTGEFDDRLPVAIREKLTYAERMQSEFESYVRQLVFNDQSAFEVVDRARAGLAEAINEINAALRAFESHRKANNPVPALTSLSA